MAFGRGLPLDHDGLVGATAGNDVLSRSTGGLLWERDPAQHINMQSFEERTSEEKGCFLYGMI